MAPLQLTVVGGLSAEVLCYVEVEEDGNISCAKAAIERTLGTPMQMQRLVATSSSRPLADDERLRDVAAREGTRVSLIRADPQWCRLLSDLASGRVELEDVDADWRQSREVVLAAVRTDGCALEWAGDELRNDREVVLTAVCESGSALRHAGEHLQADREVVLAAVQGFGLALEHASATLRGDPEVALAAVRRDLAALACTAEELKRSRDFALAVVGVDGAALRHLPEEIKRDGGVVLAALREHPSALLWAASELQADFDFMLDAVRTNGISLRYATQDMKRDPRVVLAAIGQNTQALWYGASDLKHDKRFARAVRRLLQHSQEQEKLGADSGLCQTREALLQELFEELDAAPAPSVSAGDAHSEVVLGSCATSLRAPASPRDAVEAVGLSDGDVDGVLDRMRRAQGLRSVAVLKCEALSTGSWVRIFASVPSSVEVINVQRCSLGDEGAAELGELLGCGCFPELTTVWLLSNQVGDAGGAALAAGFGARRCPRIREVWIHDELSDDSKALVRAGLPGCEVEFDDLGLTDEEDSEAADTD